MEILDVMAGPSAGAHAMIGEAKSIDCAAHIVAIVKNYLNPMAIGALEIGLARSEKIARDPRARADRPKIDCAGQGSFIPAQSPTCEIFTAIAKTSQKGRATVAAVRGYRRSFRQEPAPRRIQMYNSRPVALAGINFSCHKQS